MAYISVIPEGEADGELRDIYAGLHKPDGVIDNILQIHSLHPAGMRAHIALYTSAMAGTPGLRKVDRELIAVVVSRLNGCVY